MVRIGILEDEAAYSERLLTYLKQYQTENPDFSRITITVHGDEYVRGQIINQLKKLHNVKKVEPLSEQQCLERELMLIKVKNSPENRSEVMAASEIYRAKIIDYNLNTLCVEVTGEPDKIDAFIEVVKPLGIIEICRTGVVALERNRSITE